jgi:paraquat-inducible protein A
LIGPISLLLLVLLPGAFFVPLLSTGFWVFRKSNLTLAHAVYELYSIDESLFVIVAVFGILCPITKSIMSAYCWYYVRISTVEKYLVALSYVAKLSMLDVMLLAVFVIALKGVGIGSVHVRYGLYVYATVVVSSLVLNIAMAALARRFGRT